MDSVRNVLSRGTRCAATLLVAGAVLLGCSSEPPISEEQLTQMLVDRSIEKSDAECAANELLDAELDDAQLEAIAAEELQVTIPEGEETWTLLLDRDGESAVSDNDFEEINDALASAAANCFED